MSPQINIAKLGLWVSGSHMFSRLVCPCFLCYMPSLCAAYFEVSTKVQSIREEIIMLELTLSFHKCLAYLKSWIFAL